MGITLGSVYAFRPKPGREQVISMGMGVIGAETISADNLKMKSIRGIVFAPSGQALQSGAYRRVLQVYGSVNTPGSLSNSVSTRTAQVRGTGITSAYGGTLFIGTVGSLRVNFFAFGK